MQAGHLSRRSFLAAAASTSCLMTSRSLQAAPDFGGFTVGVQSYTFRNFDLEGMLKRTKQLGLKHAEFFSKHIPTDSTPEKLTAILKLCKEYEVTPIGFGVSGFSKNHDANRKLFEFGKAIGANYLSADPSMDSFDSLDKLCEEYKIAIAIHPHGPVGKGRHQWCSAEVILRAVKDHHKLIGTCLDTGHLLRMEQLGEKLDPAEQIKLMGERNFALHLKDYDNKKREDVPFGDPAGQLDVQAVLKALKSAKFTGHIAIEYEANPDDPAPDVKKCIAHLKNAAEKLG
ncbi:Xylose isomerase-like TIM barrel [Gemmata obscuriglobus]|uniref:Sugar phosphate isomerase/epimerase n=1 Tax=Gemmata obscuriglobus TaxID=114 RepID=A0A2Z3GZH8_9BACT|nr:sugar phosphate isomerase/epimerase [Gemmata obscuriglobus]AWM38081.1 sugar phosphate isomerase/epimerase [Gemmata obscuriglobus]QEG29041.1 Xylose isomerase-like TIM barrel [Gemmata obscuriglobus]VTS07657.1 Sugar phosphate isomerase/epimerase OS=Singulisphaera acidiphila (strain ATCC BAA-1392 / DSM 18658 / VKM B-2454 / MOB10) GN=Sinac_6399 PE=4 SV=1: AP_endonuc_2 [Gemmata obscuriglobus UQM 2246]